MQSRRKSSDAKEFILDVAEEALIEVGVDGLKIGGLAERASMRHSNLIYHFGSIQGLRTELMNRLIGRYVSEVVDIVQEVNGKENDDTIVTTNLIIERIFKMYSEPYMPALIGWKLSRSSEEPFQQVEIMVEGFIKVTSAKLSELGRIEQSSRENILKVIHMVLSVCIGNMFLNSLWSKNLTGKTNDEFLKSWVVESVTAMIEKDSINLG